MDNGERPYSRRELLTGAGATGVALLTGCAGTRASGAAESDERGARTGPGERPDEPVWGAVYFPADAYNAWQTWADYDREQVVQDLGYAADINLNAVRVFTSYEYWQDDEDGFEAYFEHFLDTADRYGIDVLPVLFESLGDNPTTENVRDKDIASAYAVRSPSTWEIVEHYADSVDADWLQDTIGWARNYLAERPREPTPAEYTERMSQEYGSDDRMIALEIMNEPRWKPFHYRFADDMLCVARETNPDATLTMGSRKIAFNDGYSTELDVYQFHYNFPRDVNDMRNRLEKAEQFAAEHDRPIWLTEWQRIQDVPHTKEDCPEDYPHYPAEKLPHYESVAETVRESVSREDGGIDGAHFWSLMLKPAYLRRKRRRNVINGLFYPDGTVWDADDGRAIAGDTMNSDERKELAGPIDGMERFLRPRFLFP